jgi:CRISPR system Cascade subunit CasE
MYLSRVNVLAEKPDKLAEILKADHYQLHQLLWRLFPNQDKEAKRDFLFRKDDEGSFPRFYLLSASEPVALSGILNVESKCFNPELRTGDRLSFNLRSNPVEQITQAKNPEDQIFSRIERKQQGLKDKKIRHDVVMHLKKSLSDENKRHDVVMRLKNFFDEDKEDYSQAELEQFAGEKWLVERAEKNGFKLLSVIAHGYQQHHFKRRKIKISTLDFEGILEITDPELFKNALFKGIGSAKAFGCGLMLIKRA